MIITEINGGLGNQLFQYAAGLSLANRHHTNLKINVQFKQADTVRSLGLSNFNIKLQEASDSDLRKYYPFSHVERIFQRILPVSCKKFYSEKKFAYQSSFEQLGSNVYLKGYWQSELYFSSIKEDIKSAFTLVPESYEQSAPFIEELHQIESVAIHVRKGDYLLTPYDDYYASLEVDYYNNAIQILKDKIDHLKIFVFTDDNNWVINNLRLDSPYIVVSGNQTKTMYEDFKAMQSCKYHIIANSSFSWWTAWLSDRPDKIVIAPKKWFKNGPKDTQDLIPKSWLIV